MRVLVTIINISIMLNSMVLSVNQLDCDYKNCNMGVDINPPLTEKQNITVEHVNSTLVGYYANEKSYAFRITRLWSYCNNIPFMRQEADCKPNSEIFEVDDIELMNKAKLREQCPIGRICETDQCYGGDSDLCLKPSLTDWVSPNQRKEAYPSTNDLYHTCIQHWHCEAISFNTYPILSSTDPYEWIIETPQGEVVPITSKGGWTKTKLGYSLWTPILNNTYEMIETPCIRDLDDNWACLVPSKSIVFKMGPKAGRAIFHNFALTPQTFIRKTASTTSNLFDRLTVQDFNEALRIVSFLNDQSIFNTNQLVEEINQLKMIVSKMIVSLSRTHKDLVANIIGVPGVSIINQDEKVLLCPCKKREETCTSINYEELLNEQKSDIAKLCMNVTQTKIAFNYKLFNKITLSEERIREFEALGSVIDEYKNEIRKMEEDKAAKGMEDHTHQGLSWFQSTFSKIHEIIIATGAYISWILLIIFLIYAKNKLLSN